MRLPSRTLNHLVERLMQRILLPILLAFASQANGATDYGYCEITGLALGAEKEFVGSVAARILDRQGLMGDPGCQAVWQDSYRTGKRLSTGGEWSELDRVKWQKLQDFEAKVLDSVINDLGLDK